MRKKYTTHKINNIYNNTYAKNHLKELHEYEIETKIRAAK